MTVVAELSVPTDQFALSSALAAAPSVRVELARSVTHGQGWMMPFMWAWDGDRAAFEAAIRDDETVDEACVVDRYDRVDQYVVRWDDDVRELVNRIFDRSGILLEATGRDPSWRLVVQFVDYASLRDLEEHLQRDDTPLQLERLYDPESPHRIEDDLTPQQLETLLVAAERGYFDVPRGATLGDLARELGVSTTAVSERLRRGIGALVASSLEPESPVERGVRTR